MSTTENTTPEQTPVCDVCPKPSVWRVDRHGVLGADDQTHAVRHACRVHLSVVCWALLPGQRHHELIVTSLTVAFWVPVAQPMPERAARGRHPDLPEWDGEPDPRRPDPFAIHPNYSPATRTSTP